MQSSSVSSVVGLRSWERWCGPAPNLISIVAHRKNHELSCLAGAARFFWAPTCSKPVKYLRDWLRHLEPFSKVDCYAWDGAWRRKDFQECGRHWHFLRRCSLSCM